VRTSVWKVSWFPLLVVAGSVVWYLKHNSSSESSILPGQHLLEYDENFGGRCGPRFGNAVCGDGRCCSHGGWCGDSFAHCGSLCASQCPGQTLKSSPVTHPPPPPPMDQTPSDPFSDLSPVSTRDDLSGQPPKPIPPVTRQGASATWLTQVGSFRVERLDKSRRAQFGRHSRAVDKFLLHTIEGTWPRNGDWESGNNALDRARAWPHFIVAKDRSGRIRIGQFIPLNVRGRALRGAANGDGVIQIEIGAKAAKPFTEHDAAITAAVRELFHTVADTLGTIPKSVDPSIRWCGDSSCPCTGAATSRARQRLSPARFKAVKGLIGHQHAYRNDHWDPGCINPSKLL